MVLTMIMICNLSANVFAQPVSNKHINVRTIEQSINEQGDIIKEVSIIGEALYYFEVKDDYVLNIGVSKLGFADIAINYKKRGVVFSKQLDLNKNSVGLAKTFEIDKNNKFEKQATDIAYQIKELVLAEKIELKEVDISVYKERAMISMRTSSDTDEIMDDLYEEGWPQAYHNVLRDSMYRDDVYAELRHSLSYSIIKKSTLLAIGGMLVSLVATIVGIPVGGLLGIASTVVGFGGLIVFARDISINNYNVYCHGDKVVNIGNNTPYRAGRTVKWNAIVADLGATLDFRYENVDHDYFDNHALLNQGIINYLTP
ncbi:MAG: hypothetical protein ACLKAK_00865 [Alkaliphilus sp.]